MKKEFLDIYDENNIFLGKTKDREFVHQDGDWHQTVHIYVFNDHDELLVHLRSPFKDLCPNCWDTRFGGHVKAGDQIIDTAIKEMNEEIGIIVNKNNLIKGEVYKYNGGKNRQFNNTFYYFWQKNDHVNFNDMEVIEVKWMNIEDIIESKKNSIINWGSSVDKILEIYERWKNLKPRNL